jgi:pimeloyl-ACP methyl ester carboxylesterase
MDYDEFAYFHENAAEFGLPYEAPPVVRRLAVEVEPGRTMSALIWGEADPELVFLHGGAQNAHTWDTLALALGKPMVAIDLPGHGHSDSGREGSLGIAENAADVARTMEDLAPRVRAVVGMSLGGMTAIALGAASPRMVPAMVLVDITPGVTAAKSAAIGAFVNGPESFPDFDAILARTVEHNPTRTVSSLRRGILHNAAQRADGTWVWRHARFRARESTILPDLGRLWDHLSAYRSPLMLVRGMAAGSVVDDDDEAELLKRVPHARVERVEGAGHSVQGDKPIELAALINDFVASLPTVPTQE